MKKGSYLIISLRETGYFSSKRNKLVYTCLNWLFLNSTTEMNFLKLNFVAITYGWEKNDYLGKREKTQILKDK
jgi:hypothetical protein